MPHDRDDDSPLPSPAERHIARSRIDERPAGPLTDQQLHTQRSVESYLRGQNDSSGAAFIEHFDTFHSLAVNARQHQDYREIG